MHLSSALAALTTVLLLPAAQAESTWCNFYHDSNCQGDANNGVSFDCANPAVFESGGDFVQCHHGRDVGYMCLVSRCSDQNCTCARNMVIVTPIDCLHASGQGSWYQLRALDSR
ncbi:hypothetical protein PG991_016036 [Apiospora marii]|uniref:Uncharacterized protein n=2 Tax=Apiospora marii TaxID=335849 RepID=A0ABR1R0E5_9PEZI